MTIPAKITRQRDFSAGMIQAEAKRRDDVDVQRAAAREMTNWRIQNSGNLKERPGTRAQFLQLGRTEQVDIAAGESYLMSFSHAGGPGGSVVFRSMAGAQISGATGYSWSLDEIGLVTYDVVNRDVVICSPDGTVPKVARIATGGASVSFFDFTFRIGASGQQRAPFYRFPASLGMTLLPSARSGAITLLMSAPWFVSGHIGTRFRYAGKQVQITAVTDSTHANATVIEELPASQTIYLPNTTVGWEVGQVIEGATTGARGEIVAVSTVVNPVGPGAGTYRKIDVILSTNWTGFTAELVIGPNSRDTIVASGFTAPGSTTPFAALQWDEVAMSDYRGWPRSVTVDRQRLIFSDFPQIPEGVAWSRIGAYDDFYPDSEADSAIFEFVPHKSRVLYVVGGADQFVFTTKRVYYIPISAAAPLKPGSIEFREITSEGAAQVKPVSLTEGTVYVVAGHGRVSVLIGTGQTARPWLARDASKYHADLFRTPVALAVSSGEGDYPEQYVYVANADGTMAVGRFEEAREWLGWVLWQARGAAIWVHAKGENVFISSRYANVVGGGDLVERLDETAVLDGQFTLNDPPDMSVPPGFGPLFLLCGQKVDLWLDGRDLGQRDVDLLGNIVPIENDYYLEEATLQVGTHAQSVLEPFVRQTDEGQSFEQTMRRRRVIRSAVTYVGNCGFTWDNQRVSPYRWGDVTTSPAPAREETKTFRHIGRSHDPRKALVKDRPGALKILELGLELSV